MYIIVNKNILQNISIDYLSLNFHISYYMKVTACCFVPELRGQDVIYRTRGDHANQYATDAVRTAYIVICKSNYEMVAATTSWHMW
jgi:hypothetical protein